VCQQVIKRFAVGRTVQTEMINKNKQKYKSKIKFLLQAEHPADEVVESLRHEHWPSGIVISKFLCNEEVWPVNIESNGKLK
jgi:hypothetical protein